MLIVNLLLVCFLLTCDCYKILGIFPYNGRSHHIFYSSLVEELAKRGHDVTVINYHPMKKLSTLRQISLQDKEKSSDRVDIEEHLKLVSNDLLMVYDSAKIFKYLANTNCKKLMINREIQELVQSKEHFDVAIVEQFVTDCGLAIAYKLNAPTVGMTAHILMPWTYSRLGSPYNAAFVPNHHFACGVKPNLLNRIKSTIINIGMNMYYTNVIQKSDQEIINDMYPGIPPLEDLGKNMSLIMLNQFFPVTGPRLYGPNVVEIGGMHINEDAQVLDKDLQQFLDTSDTEVVYISFGTVAANFPIKINDEIKKVIMESNMRFVWKTELTDWTPSSNNVFIRNWMPQVAVLCHPKVLVFVTHSGMLSTSEAMHCGVPIVGVPLFGDQFANGVSAVESGLGVILDITTLDKDALGESLRTVLQDKYQNKAKILSRVWRDRPLTPMNTSIYWIEYVARNKEDVNMKPPTVDLPLYQYFALDLLFVFSTIVAFILYTIVKLFMLLRYYLCLRLIKKTSRVKKQKKA